MRPALLAVMLLAACSKSDDKPAADKPAPPAVTPAADATSKPPAVTTLTDREQVCDLLTPAEVEAELKIAVTAKKLPKTGEYSAPSCAWTGSADGGVLGVEVLLFFHPDSEDAAENFKEKLRMCPPDKQQTLPGIADEAVLCGGLWIRKGNNFFNVTPADDVPGDAANWIEILPRLAKLAVARLP